LTNAGSFEIPTKEIVAATAERTWGTPYLKVRYRTNSGEKTCSFVFSTSLWMVAGGVDLRKRPIEKLAEEIERLKKEP